MGSPTSGNRRKILAVAGFSIIAVSAIYVWATEFLGPKAGITKGFKAKDLSVTGLDGESFTLSKHLGEVIVLEFTTTWCGYCEFQFEELEALHENVEGVLIVSIEVDPALREDSFKAWAAGKGFDWLVAHSPEAGRTYEITGVPTVIVVDKEGIIRYRGYYTTSEELEPFVRQLQ